MKSTTQLISNNLKRLRELKGFSQKQVSVATGIPQGQYSRVEPSVSTPEKLAKVFEVSIAEFFKSDDLDQELNLPLLEKVKMIDALDNEEQNALLKVIDLALANKRLKDNLSSLLAS